MMIHEITVQVGRNRKRKRVGRGPGSGHGKTCGRGHKGAGSRSGFTSAAAREGGQTPFFRRLPKRGFSNVQFQKLYAVVNVRALDARFDDGAEINAEMLVKAGLIPDTKTPIKILGHGETRKKFNVTASAFSASATQKITDAGGPATVAA